MARRKETERAGDKLGETQKNEKRELNRAGVIEKKMRRHIHGEGGRKGEKVRTRESYRLSPLHLPY